MSADQWFDVLLGCCVGFVLAAMFCQVMEIAAVPQRHRPGPLATSAVVLMTLSFVGLTGMCALLWSGAVQ